MSELRYDSCAKQVWIGVGILVGAFVLVVAMGVALEARTKGERMVQESATYISDNVDLLERDQLDRIHRSW